MNNQVGGGHYAKYLIQPIDWALDNYINAAESSVLRYLMRYRDKNGVEDLDKAIHYIEILMRRIFVPKNEDAIKNINQFCNENELKARQRMALMAMFDHDYIEAINIIKMMRQDYD